MVQRVRGVPAAVGVASERLGVLQVRLEVDRRVGRQRSLLKLLHLLLAPLLLHPHELLLLLEALMGPLLLGHGEEIVEVVRGRVWVSWLRCHHLPRIQLLHLLEYPLVGYPRPSVHEQRPQAILSLTYNLFHISLLVYLIYF